MKAIEQQFRVVMFITLFKVVLVFFLGGGRGILAEILKLDHSHNDFFFNVL